MPIFNTKGKKKKLDFDIEEALNEKNRQEDERKMKNKEKLKGKLFLNSQKSHSTPTLSL